MTYCDIKVAYTIFAGSSVKLLPGVPMEIYHHANYYWHSFLCHAIKRFKNCFHETPLKVFTKKQGLCYKETSYIHPTSYIP